MQSITTGTSQVLANILKKVESEEKCIKNFPKGSSVSVMLSDLHAKITIPDSQRYPCLYELR